MWNQRNDDARRAGSAASNLPCISWHHPGGQNPDELAMTVALTGISSFGPRVRTVPAAEISF